MAEIAVEKLNVNAGNGNAVVDPSANPIYLHPNENPGSVLVTPILDNNNYHSWSRDMLMALKTKNKICFVDGSMPKPAIGHPNFLAWDRCNTLVLSWIYHSMEQSVKQSVASADTAEEVWKELRERYYQGDVFRIGDLQEELYACKQGDDSITVYFTRLKGIWQELENFRPIPSCLCQVKCTCTLIPTIRTYRDNDYVIRFLKGLNEQYSAVKSQIMLMDPLPTINKTFSLLTQQERQMNPRLEESQILANTTDIYGRGRGNGGRGNRGRGQGGRGRKVCSYCHKTGHMVDTCFKKHGYPPHFQKSANNLLVEEEIEDEDQDFNDNKSSKSLMGQPNTHGFTPEQHKAILNMLQNLGASTSSSGHDVSANQIVSTSVNNKSGQNYFEEDWCS